MANDGKKLSFEEAIQPLTAWVEQNFNTNAIAAGVAAGIGNPIPEDTTGAKSFPLNSEHFDGDTVSISTRAGKALRLNKTVFLGQKRTVKVAAIDPWNCEEVLQMAALVLTLAHKGVFRDKPVSKGSTTSTKIRMAI